MQKSTYLEDTKEKQALLIWNWDETNEVQLEGNLT